MAGLQTEFEFTLPKGYVDDVGVVHRDGLMRLATARDEIEPLRNHEVDGPDDPYLTVLVLARVLTELGTIEPITPQIVEGLFAADLAFLQDLYGIVNFGDVADLEALHATVEVAAPPPAESPVDVADSGVDAPEPSTMTTSSSMPSRGYVEEVPSTAS